MHPLCFLVSRSIVNGVRRAFTSPQRLIGLIVVIGYYFSFVFRAFVGPSTMPGSQFPTNFPIPKTEVVEAILFGLFAVLSILMSLTAISPRGGFRAADVDVLFATPVNPRIVLFFRMGRDYLLALLAPFFFILISGRGAAVGYAYMFGDHSDNGVRAIKLMSVAWFLMSLAWVCLGFGLSLFVNRSDEKSDRNRRIINGWILGSLLAGLGYLALRLQGSFSVETAVATSQSWLERTLFFTATAATAIVSGALEGNALEMVLGVAALVGLCGLGVWLANTQVGYMYDQAAARGFDSLDMKKLQRSGDMYGISAERARRGKMKNGRLARQISRMHVHGGPTLLWKETLLQLRGSGPQFYFFGAILCTMLIPLYAARHASSEGSTILFLTIAGMGVLMFTMFGSTTGYIELLRRVDLQKPLPFSPATTVFWEIVAKAIPSTAFIVMVSVAATAIDPRLWQMAVAVILMMPTFAAVISAVVLIVTILFPDVEDAAQRGFRGLMTMLGSAIALFISAIAFGLLAFLLHLSPILAAIPAIMINLGITLGVSALAGSLYASFNPSD